MAEAKFRQRAVKAETLISSLVHDSLYVFLSISLSQLSMVMRQKGLCIGGHAIASGAGRTKAGGPSRAAAEAAGTALIHTRKAASKCTNVGVGTSPDTIERLIFG